MRGGIRDMVVKFFELKYIRFDKGKGDCGYDKIVIKLLVFCGVLKKIGCGNLSI